MLLMDGVKYLKWVPQSEEELERFVSEHASEIFSENSMYFDRKLKLQSLSGIGSIPDGYAIVFGDSLQWHIIEVELSSHPLYNHIVPQISRFISGINNLSTQKMIADALFHAIIADAVYYARVEKVVQTGEIYKFVADLISKPPILTIIIDKDTEELREALNTLRYPQIKVVEFQTFTREGAGLAVHAHLFEPLYKPAIQPLIPLSAITSPIETPRKAVEQITVKDLIDANTIKVGQVIHKLYKGQRFEGKVLNDGSIELAHIGKKFNSLSMAAAHITSINENGWRWWHTTKENGTECQLDELRKEYRGTPSP